MKPTPTDELITELVNTIKETKTFVVEQAPDVIQQLLLYKTINTSIWLAASTLLLVGGLWAFFHGGKLYRKDSNDDTFIPYSVFGAIAVLSGAVWSINEALDLIKLLVAPKVFLLQYAAQLLRSI